MPIIPGKPVTPSSIVGEATIRIITSPFTSDPAATFTTTEVVQYTLSVPLEAGRRYGITVMTRARTATAAAPSVEVALVRLREDTVSGTELGGNQAYMPNNGTVGFPVFIYAEYVAVATGNKTFVVCGIRNGGAGTHNLRGSATGPTWVLVDLLPD